MRLWITLRLSEGEGEGGVRVAGCQVAGVLYYRKAWHGDAGLQTHGRLTGCNNVLA